MLAQMKAAAWVLTATAAQCLMMLKMVLPVKSSMFGLTAMVHTHGMATRLTQAMPATVSPQTRSILPASANCATRAVVVKAWRQMQATKDCSDNLSAPAQGPLHKVQVQLHDRSVACCGAAPRKAALGQGGRIPQRQRRWDVPQRLTLRRPWATIPMQVLCCNSYVH